MKNNRIGLMVLFLISTLFLVGCTGGASSTSVEVPLTGATKEITIEAFNWGFTQTPVQINKGDLVRIKLTSTSGTHGFAMPDFRVYANPIKPGQEQVVEFVADKSGTFQNPVVTEITEVAKFYPAEDYHQQYLAKRGMDSCG